MLVTSMDDWRTLAACRDMDLALWFPTLGATGSEAKAVCRTCPVVADCAAYARAEHIHSGIWGGRSLEPHRRRHAPEPVRIIPRHAKESA